MAPSTVLALAVAAGVLTLAVVVVLLVWVRQERVRAAALMARLEELEARLEGASAEPTASPISEPPAAAGHPEPTPSGDVLAGLTSRVGRLVARSGEPAGTLAEQAILCVHRNLSQALTAHGLAEELHVSLRTLERGLLLALDCTPRQLILATKMREARRLLLAGRLLVKEVAFRLGFGDQYHFSRCFKSFYHVAPSDVRPATPGLR